MTKKFTTNEDKEIDNLIKIWSKYCTQYYNEKTPCNNKLSNFSPDFTGSFSGLSLFKAEFLFHEFSNFFKQLKIEWMELILLFL